MKLSVRCAAWVLPLMLTACSHRVQTAKNQSIAPPLSGSGSEETVPVKPIPIELPPSASTIPPQPIQNAQAPTEDRPKPHHRRPKPQPQTEPPAAEIASNGGAGVSAIGQLSSGDPADVRRDTEDTIISIDKSLSSIHRPLSDAEQKTADHIREFLKQARTALATGDVDGAHTLASKAKVLLAELTK
jgi:hypothetical protein